MSPNQLDLFNQPSFTTVVQDVKIAMNHAIKTSNLTREQVLDRMNHLALRSNVRLINGNGKTLTIDTFNKWLNIEDEIRMPSLKALPIFCAAAGSTQPMAVLARLVGARLIDKDEVRLLEWASCYHKAKDLRKEMRELETKL